MCCVSSCTGELASSKCYSEVVAATSSAMSFARSSAVLQWFVAAPNLGVCVGRFSLATCMVLVVMRSKTQDIL